GHRIGPYRVQLSMATGTHRSRIALASATLACLSVATSALAQAGGGSHAGMDHDSSSHANDSLYSLGARGIALATVASPALNGRSAREGYLTQPMLMGRFNPAGGRVVVEAMVNFEGLTLERGELNAGIYGEGYVDRRHPHTYLHELVATLTGEVKSSRFSITVGKGFVAFGTDDPMSRPFVKYPLNHHLAQILERAVVSGAVRYGPLSMELARFNGDEPESPGDFPNGKRLWDSWAVRGTLLPRAGWELQTSVAEVKSPEVAQGGGLDQRKLSASLRYQPASTRYGLVEWARTADRESGRTAFAFASALAEGAISRGRVTIAVRAERTERPEEERLGDLFRTPRPHSDFNILGRTRWDVLTGGISADVLRKRPWIVAPFIEVSTQHASSIARPAVFDPREFYGASRLWSFSAGVRLAAGMLHSRMGRYGAAVADHRN
ncbi:MAG: hypothetical protein ABIR58_07320, partial [Gemmatimonadaceae bacterium]